MPEEIPVAERQTKKERGFFWEAIRFALVAFLIVMPFRLWIAQPFIVRGASMDPSFTDGEYLIVDELSYHLRPPERGEVVIFRYPIDPKTFFIKRIIGLSGETIIIQGGKVSIQDADGAAFLLQEAYLPKSTETMPDMHKKLGPDEYFVMGDNRLQSLDSRSWGTLSRKLITGRTLIRLWPPARAKVLPGMTRE